MDEEIFRLRDDLAKTMPTSLNKPHSADLTELPVFTVDKLFFCNFCPKAFDTERERQEHNQKEFDGRLG